MTPGNITAIVALIMTLITPALQHVGWLQQFPDGVQFIQEAIQYALLALVTIGSAFLSNNGKWEKIMRLVPTVIAYVKDYQAGASQPELRARAIKDFTEALAGGGAGWRGWIMRFPVVGKWIVGTVIDRMASGINLITGAPSSTVALRQAKSKLSS